MIAAFIGGLTQFFTPTHLVAVAALGLLAGQDARRLSIATLASFALGLIAGSLAIAFAVRETPAAMALLAIAAVAGLIVVVALPLPMLNRHALAFLTGAALALNSPPQAISIPSAIAAQLGTSVAALATLIFIIVCAMQADRPWRRIGVRIAGSWIAASAILVLALRLAR